MFHSFGAEQARPAGVEYHQRQGVGEQLLYSHNAFQGGELYREPGRLEVNGLDAQHVGAWYFGPAHAFLPPSYGMMPVASTLSSSAFNGVVGYEQQQVDQQGQVGWSPRPMSAEGMGTPDGQEMPLHHRRTGASSTLRVDVPNREGSCDKGLSTAALKFVDEYLNFPSTATTPVHPIAAKQSTSPAKLPDPIIFRERIQSPPGGTSGIDKSQLQQALVDTTARLREELLSILKQRGSLDHLPKELLVDVNSLLVIAGRVRDGAASLTSQQSQANQLEHTPSLVSSAIGNRSEPSDLTLDDPTEAVQDLLPQEKYYRGGWKPVELARLRKLVEQSASTFSSTHVSSSKTENESRLEGGYPTVDWNWVCGEMAGLRSRHQVLCKAVEVGLRKSETRRGPKKSKGKKSEMDVP